jgi:subtilisin family serine protease
VVLDEILVTLTEEATQADERQLASDLGGLIAGRVPAIRLVQIRSPNPENDPLRLDNALARAFDEQHETVVENAFPNEVLGERMVPNDPWGAPGDNADWATPGDTVWGQHAIDLPAAWDITTGTGGIKIGVVDSGFMSGHKDFEGRAQTRKLAEELGCDRDHGTHVAGIIGATGNNKKGIAGVNWQSELYLYTAMKIFGTPGESKESTPKFAEQWCREAPGKAYLSAIMDGVARAVDEGVKVINLSVGIPWEKRHIYPEGNPMLTCNRWAEQQRKAWRPVIQHLKDRALLVVGAGNLSEPSKNKVVDARWSYGPVLLADEFKDNGLALWQDRPTLCPTLCSAQPSSVPAA